MAVLYEIGKKALCHELNEHKFFITFDASAQKKCTERKILPSSSLPTHLLRKKTFLLAFRLEVLTTRTFMIVAQGLRVKIHCKIDDFFVLK